jgi:hypothetical protein
MTFTTTIHYDIINKASILFMRPHDPNWNHIVDWKSDLKTAYGLTINDHNPQFHWSEQYWPVTFDSETDCTLFLLKFA